MRGMVENYCPEVKLNPGLPFTSALQASVNIIIHRGQQLAGNRW